VADRPQQIFGYFLIPVNKAQKSFVFVGAPNAGKSTLLAVAQEILLGSENVSNIAWQSLGDRFNKAELFGKLANIFADLPSKAIDDNGLFKALTGEDYITAERKNKDPFSFKPYARFLFSCNDIPRNYGDRSDGFFRRLILIRFSRSVPKQKRDAGLREKLATESDGIFMWALEGLKRLMSNGYCFTETAATKAELEKYKTESSSSLSFASVYLAAEDGAVVARDEVYERYKAFCNDSGFKSLSQTMFNRDIEAQFPEIQRCRDRISKRRTWAGLRYYPEGRDTD
jgi:putative DNA primase/helicase